MVPWAVDLVLRRLIREEKGVTPDHVPDMVFKFESKGMSTQDVRLIPDEAAAKEVFDRDSNDDWKERQQRHQDEGTPPPPRKVSPVTGEAVFRASALKMIGGWVDPDEQPRRNYHYNVFLDYDLAEALLREKDKDKQLPLKKLGKGFIDRKSVV